MAKEAVVGKQVTCANCGWSWSTNDSSPSDKYICHTCGKDNENATLKNGGWLNKYNDAPEAQNGIEGTMGGLTDKGFNYNGAWGGTMAMGGSLPGSVGFTYARTQSPAPSNGPYAKKTKASAQNGKKTNKNSNIQEQRYEQLYPPLIDKIINSASNDYESLPFGNRMFIETKFDGLSNPEGRNLPPMDPTIKEVQNKILALPESELNKLLKVDWKNISAPGAFLKKPKGIGMGDMFRYINHFKKLKSQGYTLQNGGEMKYYQEGLDWKPKNISRDGGWLSKYEEGGIIEDDMGQWAHPGEITKINSNQITMQGVDYPVLGISDTGDTQMMQPGEDYTYDGDSVTEIPMAQNGITRGGYDDPDYVTGTSRRAFNKMVGMGNYLVPANTLNRAADLAKAKGLDYGAITSGPADAVRHAAAAASVASRLPVPQFIGQYSPAIDRAIRIAGANLLGIGNEVMSLNPEGLLMDIKNNYQGSLIGSIPGLNDKTRNKMIINQLQKGKLTVDNPKKPKKENGGWLNKYK